MVSKSIRDRFAHASIGDTMQFGKGSWKVVGVFDAGGSAYESEVWGDVNQMASDFDRQGGYSSAYLRATDPISADALKNRVSDDQRLKLEGVLENDYYAKQTSSGTPIKVIGWVVGVIMAVGSIFAAMNTMYAAVAYRGREIATLRVIGFSRPAILTSFVLESLLLALLGALVGILLMLPFNGMQTGTSNAVTFSEVVFALRITPGVAIRAIIFALIMGFVGGLAPAWHAARQNILTALRGVARDRLMTNCTDKIGNVTILMAIDYQTRRLAEPAHRPFAARRQWRRAARLGAPLHLSAASL